ncbi:metallophosphoesterase family protein [Alkalitalea saponilacus]|uniref:Nuclease SbcCD subunit D n=1 Tax=Alkalitalea saponilacus TaxID=889453 RepID=A0A1T5ETG7_9BACT|nr:exonuclease subunit SbcD [Alkalitalea saponilacus]ASB48041.1 exonuclease sbcCD subunit D [Alkalitalea saponilacus]SKB87000.1 Exodeoxyribonuclease I subunit D [Alkalitalea saponilacus]
MRFLHTSDWHLGKRLERFSRIEEQREVLEEICEIAERENVDVVLIAGDLFDAFNPSSEAVELFYRMLKKMTDNGKRAVIAIAGNHDSPERIEAPDPLARECGIIFAGMPDSQITPFSLESGLKILSSEPGFIELNLPDYEYPLRLLLTPYANELRLKTMLAVNDKESDLREILKSRWENFILKNSCKTGVNVLMTHLFVMNKGEEKPEEPDDEKPILYVGGAQPVFSSDFPEGLHYVALGHLHRPHQTGGGNCPVVYSGSPLAYSFAETNQQKMVYIIDAEPGRAAEVRTVELKSGYKLISARFDDEDAALEWLRDNQEVYVELTIVSENYITAESRRKLFAAHPRIVTLIPEVKAGSESGSENHSKSIDLTKSTEELFVDFFKEKKGQLPNKRVVEIFKELLAQQNRN